MAVPRDHGHPGLPAAKHFAARASGAVRGQPSAAAAGRSDLQRALRRPGNRRNGARWPAAGRRPVRTLRAAGQRDPDLWLRSERSAPRRSGRLDSPDPVADELRAAETGGPRTQSRHDAGQIASRDARRPIGARSNSICGAWPASRRLTNSLLARSTCRRSAIERRRSRTFSGRCSTRPNF